MRKTVDTRNIIGLPDSIEIDVKEKWIIDFHKYSRYEV